MLSRLQNLQETIKISIIGVGTMGKGLLYQASITPGIECVAIADVEVHKCVDAARWLGIPHRVVNTQNEMDDAINDGYLAICEDGNMVSKAASVEAVVEASSSISEGAEYALTAIKHKRHLILMNAEIDLVFGPHLMKLAQEAGVSYTSCDGGTHTAISNLFDDMQLWGFDPVMAGGILGTLDRTANPTKMTAQADLRDADYRVCTALADGTHLNIEMALVANALDMVTAVPGMYGFEAQTVHDVLSLYDLKILHSLHKPVVDYLLGAQPHGGVFTVGFCDNPHQASMLSQYQMGNGPFYVFYRPYRLRHVEAMAQIAKAVLDDAPMMQPTYGLRTNVYTYAKTDLRAGQTLDGVGGYNTYGMIENCPPINEDWGLPICLADGVVLRRDLGKDEKVSLMDVEFDPTALEFELYFKSQKRDLVYVSEAAFRPGQYTHW